MNAHTGPRPRLDLAPALPLLRNVAATMHPDAGPTAALARLLGLSRRQAGRIHAERAIADHHADRLALALGHHPRNLWPEQWPALS